MCGRYANHVRDMGAWADILENWPDEVALGYNIAPTRIIPTFIQDHGHNQGLGMRWGLVPSWSREASPKFATFNARSETVAEKPTFRTAWKRSQTCLVPALGYYEWTGEKGSKQPYFIRTANGEPLVFAGLWDLWKKDNQEMYSCTILTQPAEGKLKEIHPRMPVMVERSYAEGWLSDGIHRFNIITKQQHTDRLEFYPVNKTVNRSTSEGETLILKEETL